MANSIEKDISTKIGKYGLRCNVAGRFYPFPFKACKWNVNFTYLVGYWHRYCASSCSVLFISEWREKRKISMAAHKRVASHLFDRTEDLPQRGGTWQHHGKPFCETHEGSRAHTQVVREGKGQVCSRLTNIKLTMSRTVKTRSCA